MQPYTEFVDKFKPRHTTDDCYTPPKVYEAVLTWVEREYNIDRKTVIRPFYPDKDYQKEDYTGRVVVDNPPFSCLAKIVDWYLERNIKFFMFANGLTVMNLLKRKGVCVIMGTQITYENGAIVPTAFITNLDTARVRVSQGFTTAIITACKKPKHAYGVVQNRAGRPPKYIYPDNVVTAARMYTLSRHGGDITIHNGYFTRALDAQKPYGRKVFGAGILISDVDAQNLKAKEQNAKEQHITWELSEREREIIKSLGETL